MSIFHIQLENLTIENIQSLVDNSVGENRNLEYKRELNVRNDQGKKEFLADISSFANTSGGDIIYGIEETDGVPTAILPIQINVDEEVLRLTSIIQTGLSPRINFHFESLEYQGGIILILRIFQFYSGPVMISLQSNGKFFARHTNGKYQMDQSQIVNHAIKANSIRDEFTKFRNGRIDYFLSGEAGNDPSLPFILFYIYPITSFTLDLNTIERENTIEHLRPLSGGYRSSTFNLDGFKVYYDFGSQVQVFRNAAIEYFDSTFPIYELNNNGIPLFPMRLFEHALIDRFESIKSFFFENSIIPPFILNLNFYNFSNYRPHFDFDLLMSGFHYNTNTRNEVFLPEIIIEDIEDTHSILRPIFDDFWRVFGLPRCGHYNDLGERIR